MDMSWCNDCGPRFYWTPSIVSAASIVIAFVFGYAIQRVADRFGFRSHAVVITIALSLGLAVFYWVDTYSVYAILPFGALIVGVCQRRNDFASVFGDR